MTAHSPGPWRWSNDDLLDADDHTVIDGGGDWTLAEGANARLIAAAPDLLALARYAAERGEGDAEMARALIARIEGP